MTVLGIRSAPSVIRYAIVSLQDDGSIAFRNAQNENKISFPADYTTPCQRIPWLANEIARIIHQNNDIDRMIIKIAEYGGNDSTSSREIAYNDAIAIYQARIQHPPIEVVTKTYQGLGNNINRDSVQSIAERIVGRTNRYWNTQIADAIVAALYGLERL